MPPLLEVACFSIASAQAALTAGADRIELCADYSVGGITPPYDWLADLKRQSSSTQHGPSVPVMVMIRPRGGDFVYSAGEVERMQADIARFLPIADGFVFGLLRPDRTIDIERTRTLVQQAGKPCTFHRAFDDAPDADAALEDVIETGCQTVLTSGCGGGRGAAEGLAGLAKLVQRADERITIMAGGGVRAENVGEIQARTGASAVHTSGLGSPDSPIADVEEIRRVKRILLGQQGPQHALQAEG